MSTEPTSGAIVSDRASQEDTLVPNDQSSEKRSLLIDVLRETAKNFAMSLPPVRAWRLNRPRAGTIFADRDEDLERYAFSPLRALQEILGSVEGLDIVEIGPGDFMTSGLSLLAAGAKSYTVVDRFIGDYEKPEAKDWYRGIQDAWPRFFPLNRWPDNLLAEDFPEAYSDRIHVLRGTIEDVQPSRKYDVVCSFQVGEHVRSIEAFAQKNAQLLKPDGTAVHRVDFGPHDCWHFYQNRLTFLRFPDWLWWMMGSNRGIPNRRRYHEFKAALERAGLDVEVTGQEYFPEEAVKTARLARKFRTMPFDSLAIGTATFICRLRKEI